MSNPYENFTTSDFANSPAQGSMFSLFSDGGAGTGVLIQWVTSPAAIVIFVVLAAVLLLAIGLAVAKVIRNGV